MNNRKAPDSNIEIDESNFKPVPTAGQKIKNVFIAITFGALLVQSYYFYIAARRGSMTPRSIVIYFDSYLFWGYLAICGVLGWFYGREFIDWLKAKTSNLIQMVNH